jgi:hypothetical protein
MHRKIKAPIELIRKTHSFNHQKNPNKNPHCHSVSPLRIIQNFTTHTRNQPKIKQQKSQYNIHQRTQSALHPEPNNNTQQR